jgi:CheY-like chemotaxis protein
MTTLPSNLLGSIMLVDDDPATNYINEIFLMKTGGVQKILKFTQSKLALSELTILAQKKNKDDFPEIIFLDLNMPVMNGFEFIDALHKIPGIEELNTSIYMVSSSDYPRDLEKAWAAGIQGFVNKPIGFERSQQIIQEAIEKKR